ncbi:MAG: WD40-repeat-containing domain protein [Monoraphidium minutum]|nr:MAG: WD40-repeat-containing domain protein [Monoraphidium minutum]
MIEGRDSPQDSVCSIAYDRAKRTIYTAAEGDKAIKVWDLKTGALLRAQAAHRGMVTAVVYAPAARLLFSASIDGAVGVWSDKGTLLQLVPTGWPLFSLAWSEHQRILVAGGNSVLHVFGVDIAEATHLKHARHAAQATSGHPAGGGAGAGGGSGGKQAPPTAAAAAALAAAAAAARADEAPVLIRVCPAFCGWPHPTAAYRRTGSAGSAARAPLDAPDGGGGGAGGSMRPSRDGAGSAGGEPQLAAALGQRGAQEHEYYSACHTDVVKCIVITDGSKIFTAGFDRAICIYDTEKLDKGRECFKRVRDCARAAITSLSLDARANVLLAGSLEGALRVWSLEGRCLDKFEGLSGRPVSAAPVPQTGAWWATGRFDRVNVVDPRALANVTAFVDMLYAPPGSDLVLAATRGRALIAWQHNPTAAHRVFKAHEDWVEGLLAAATGPDASDERLFSFSAGGVARAWELDAEQACDVYRLLDEVPLAPTNVHCLLFQPERECLIAGCADGAVRLHFLDGRAPTHNDSPLPTALLGHEGAVSGLALVEPGLLLSASHDGTLRLWDLATMKQLMVEGGCERRTPITCLEWCAARKEAGVCAQGARAYVWSFARPAAPRLALVLDHSQGPQPRAPNGGGGGARDQQPAPAPGGAAGGGGGGGGGGAAGKPSDMRWLTRSDLDGLQGGGGGGGAAARTGGALPALVAEAIRDAAVDVPEVTQIRWAGYCDCWVTAADDDSLRTWSATGQRLGATATKGGRVGCLFVDEAHGVVLAAAANKSVYVYELGEPTPLARYSGHEDVVSSICLLQALDAYATGSWDGTFRVWPRPSAAAPTAAPSCATLGGGALAQEESADGCSTAAAAAAPAVAGPSHRLGAPASKQQQHRSSGNGVRARTQDRALAAMLLIAGRTSETGSGSGAAGGGAARHLAARRSGGGAAAPRGGAAARTAPDGGASSVGFDSGHEDGGGGGSSLGDAPGTLGARLADLGRQLLVEIDGSYDGRRRAASERLGACYVAAAEAAAAADGGSRVGSFVAFPSLSGGGGWSGGGGGGVGSGMGGGGAGAWGAKAGAGGAGGAGGGAARKLGALKGAAGGKSRRAKG